MNTAAKLRLIVYISVIISLGSIDLRINQVRIKAYILAGPSLSGLYMLQISPNVSAFMIPPQSMMHGRRTTLQPAGGSIIGICFGVPGDPED